MPFGIQKRGLETSQPLYPYLGYPLGKKLLKAGYSLMSAASEIGVEKGDLSHYIRRKQLSKISRGVKKDIRHWFVAKGFLKRRSPKVIRCRNCGITNPHKHHDQLLAEQKQRSAPREGNSGEVHISLRWTLIGVYEVLASALGIADQMRGTADERRAAILRKLILGKPDLTVVLDTPAHPRTEVLAYISRLAYEGYITLMLRRGAFENTTPAPARTPVSSSKPDRVQRTPERALVKIRSRVTRSAPRCVGSKRNARASSKAHRARQRAASKVRNGEQKI